MTDLRDKIAECLPAFNDMYEGTAEGVAQDIRDLIIARIPPLVWVKSYGVWRSATPWGDYKVTGKILTLPLPMNPQQVHDSEEAAKAAADAHHVAQLCKGMGIE